MSRMPALYIPHGGGPAFFMNGELADRFTPMRNHLASIASTLPATPTAILLVSAHWEAEAIAFTAAPAPALIYDYSGFPAATYQIQYPAPGAPLLAADCVDKLTRAGVAAVADPTHGWDHGVFVPLKVMFPNANIPVVAMSLQRGLDPALHHAAGAALAPLREQGVLIIASGATAC
jgi:aromatic ring-opening dioxygenase catalytic subunit (LigB family)